jgi:type I restriction enzyme S subunit
MRVKLGDVASESKETLKGNKNGLPIVGLEHLASEEIKLNNWDTDTPNTFTKTFRKGQILFGRRRAYLKKAAVAPFDGICSGDITVIVANPDKILPELLPFVIQNDDFFDFAIGKSAGSLSPRAKWGQLKEFEFNLPSMDEQRRLSNLFWSFIETGYAYKDLLAASDELVKSQFAEMFGDPVRNEMGWDVKRLGSTCVITTGNTPPRAKSEYYGDFIEWIKTDNIQPAESFLTTATERLSEQGFEKCRYVEAGSVLMTCIAGSLNTIGNVAITDRRVAFNQQINALTPKEYDCVFLYALLIMMKAELCGAVNMMLKGILSKGNLSTIKAIVPPLPLQNRFADFVRQADKSRFALKQTISELEATYKAILREKLG